VRSLLILLFACSSGAKQPAAPPVPVSIEQRGCAEAAAGIERGTRGIRDPGQSVVSALRGHCLDDAWSAVAIECFAKMTEDDLGRCAGELKPAARDRLFTTLGDDLFFRTISQALDAYLKTHPVEWQAWEDEG